MFSHVVSNVMDRFKLFNLRKKYRWHHQCNLVNVKYAKPLFEEAKFWKNVFWHLKQSHRVTTPTCACKSRVKSDAWIQWPKNLQMLLLGQSHWCQLCRMLPGKYILMLCFWQCYVFDKAIFLAECFFSVVYLFCCGRGGGGVAILRRSWCFHGCYHYLYCYLLFFLFSLFWRLRD